MIKKIVLCIGLIINGLMVGSTPTGQGSNFPNTYKYRDRQEIRYDIYKNTQRGRSKAANRDVLRARNNDNQDDAEVLESVKNIFS